MPGPTPPTSTHDYGGHMKGGFHEGTRRDAPTERGSRETREKRSDSTRASGNLGPTGPDDPANVSPSNQGAAA
jgi:hypothetical protein